MKKLKFPQNFLWGASTSAYQIEGGNDNDWSEWETSEGRLKELESRGLDPENFICGSACDSWNRWREDIALLKKMNCNAYRFGIEWSRIEPEKGKINREALDRYREMLETMRAEGIEPVLTIWHWTNPKWIGTDGWTKRRTVDAFLKFADLAVREFGDLVRYWNPLNEPFVHLGHGYLDGKFPPNRKHDFWGAKKVFDNLVLAQKGAFEIIHRWNPGALAGVAMNTGFYEAAHRWNPVEVLMAKSGHFMRNMWYLEKIIGFYDYIGVNYYHHNRVIWHPPFRQNLNEKVSDFGWELYPEGIYHVLTSYKKFGKPLIILESGLSDVRDKYRAEYVKDILTWTHKAIQEGADVRGHFYWSLLDNFEWADGYTQKFGLAEVDRRTFERKLRPSAEAYASICKNNGFDDA
jgi:beta-glucosidase